MNQHPLDRPIASELSYRVFETRRERGELGASGFHVRDQRGYRASVRESVVVGDDRGDAPHVTPLAVADGSDDADE